MNNCMSCDGTGWVVATARSNGAVFGFRCPCPIAGHKKLSLKIPEWNTFKSAQFKPDFENRNFSWGGSKKVTTHAMKSIGGDE